MNALGLLRTHATQNHLLAFRHAKAIAGTAWQVGRTQQHDDLMALPQGFDDDGLMTEMKRLKTANKN